MPAPIPIKIRGVEYESTHAAAKALGVSPSLVAYYKRVGRLDEVGLLEPLHDGGAKPVTIRGETFPSMAEAARAFGVSVSAVSKAAAAGRLDTVGEHSVFS